ncbi:MAG TPA: NAD(P)-dependent oxidoreductase [Candidatus Limnocylindrales bacterium]|nr:NAD(P)-dependent oxidoreductase [Candidatus Limnocylindrales bacterium]
MARVAVVGTGRMGSAMARALVRAGHDVVLQNRTRDRCDPLAAMLGCRIVDTPAEAAAESDVTITMLADDAAVTEVYTGSAGLADGAHAGGVLVDMSTVLPETIRSVAATVRATGSGLLDAPVSGSVSLAESGQLTLMVGGDAADLAAARPVLESVSGTIFHLGPLGSGAVMKLAVNAVIFGLNEALAEGLVLAEAAGVERATAYDVIAAGAAGAPYVGYKRAQFVDPDVAPVAFSLALTEKDLRLISETAAALGQPLPQTAINLEIVRAAAQGGRSDRDFATVAGELRARRSKAAVG